MSYALVNKWEVINMQLHEMMKVIPRWIPGLLVIIGGLYTSIRLYLLIEEMIEMRDNANNLLTEALYSFPLVFAGSLFFPIFIGIILTTMGSIMIWKPYSTPLPYVTLCFSLLLFNWIGVIISIIGSVIGIIILNQKEKS